MSRDWHSDALIVDAVRSPIGKRNGTLSSIRGDELAGQVLNALVGRTEVDPAQVEDVQFGCVTQPSWTSSTSPGSTSCRASSAFNTCAASSSPRIDESVPLRFPIGERTASTINASECEAGDMPGLD